MKEAIVTIPYDREKLRALQLYLAKKDMSFEDEVCKMLDALYAKQVPGEVRDYLCMSSGEEPAPVVKQVRKRNNPKHGEEVNPNDNDAQE